VDAHQGVTYGIVRETFHDVQNVIREYGELPEVGCLPSQLNQVFLNMLINASQAIHGKRGTITVRTGCIDGDHVFVEIADNGEGIPPGNLKRIFDPFFTTKPVGKGTGLGLALSYGIVTRHRGRIDVRSQPGEGTTFRITLPVRQG
jgi:two-component system NtrC family sensor kinase